MVVSRYVPRVARRLLASLCLAAGLASPVATAEIPPPTPAPPVAADRDAFMLGNAVFVLLHELGHAVIRDFQVPILGLEENSADTLAALTLIQAQRHSRDGDGPYTQLLGMAAVGNILTWRSGLEREHPELIYWAQHDLSVRRGARIVCLLYGSDPQQFGWLIEAVDVPEIRADNCADEYATAAYAAAWVGKTYGRMKEGRGTDAAQEIRIEYFAARTPAQAQLAERLRKSQVVEKLTAFYDSAFRFPAPLTLRLVSCGTPNAYWDPDLQATAVLLRAAGNPGQAYP